MSVDVPNEIAHIDKLCEAIHEYICACGLQCTRDDSRIKCIADTWNEDMSRLLPDEEAEYAAYLVLLTNPLCLDDRGNEYNRELACMVGLFYRGAPLEKLPLDLIREMARQTKSFDGVMGKYRIIHEIRNLLDVWVERAKILSTDPDAGGWI